MRNRETQADSWSALWRAALEAAGWGARLKQGAAFLREDAVQGLRVQSGQATAGVATPAGGPVQPRLALRPLGAAEWATAATTILTTPALAAALAAGEWPPSLALALTAAGVALLPGPADLAADCPCGERLPCRHVGALALALAAACDTDPWLLPLLRGRSRPALAADLAAARAALVDEGVRGQGSGVRGQGLGVRGQGSAGGGQETGSQWSVTSGQETSAGPLAASRQDAHTRGEAAAASDRLVDMDSRAPDTPPSDPARRSQTASFWDSGLDGFACRIAAPGTPAPLLRALGPPPFWGPGTPFAAQLEPVYAAVTAATLRAVFGGDTPAPSDGPASATTPDTEG